MRIYQTSHPSQERPIPSKDLTGASLVVSNPCHSIQGKSHSSPTPPLPSSSAAEAVQTSPDFASSISQTSVQPPPAAASACPSNSNPVPPSIPTASVPVDSTVLPPQLSIINAGNDKTIATTSATTNATTNATTSGTENLDAN